MTRFVLSLLAICLTPSLFAAHLGASEQSESAPLLCRTQEKGVQEDSTKWYEGSYKVSSPDGKRAYGPPIVVLAKRIVQPGQSLILEIVDHPERHFEVTLKRVKGTTTFQALDKKKSWEGRIVYSGTDWDWDKWTYNIKLTDGAGSLKGKGSITDGVIRTEKIFYDPDGKAQALIIEVLKPTTEAKYKEKLKALRRKK